MLDHPWLSMPDDYSFRMSDLEFRKFKLRQTVEVGSHEFLLDEQKADSKKKEGFVGGKKFECNVS